MSRIVEVCRLLPPTSTRQSGSTAALPRPGTARRIVRNGIRASRWARTGTRRGFDAEPPSSFPELALELLPAAPLLLALQPLAALGGGLSGLAGPLDDDALLRGAGPTLEPVEGRAELVGPPVLRVGDDGRSAVFRSLAERDVERKGRARVVVRRDVPLEAPALVG